MSLRDRLQETHGPTCELLRHFLGRFFDSEIVTSPGQTLLAVIGSSSMFLVWFPFFTAPLKEKYAHLLALPSAAAYRLALRADELWLLAMMMSAVGLLTVIEWEALFPSLTDYRAIGWLPVRMLQVFGAKLGALLLVATGAIVVLTLMPAMGFPALAHTQMGPLTAALGAGCYFVFFALVAVQGILLNLLPPRLFARVNGLLQGTLAAGMLGGLVMSFSIGPPFARAITQPQVAKWLPIAWFLGICDPGMAAFAPWAGIALAASVMLALSAYAMSYRRHRSLMVEGIAAARKRRYWPGAIFDRMLPDTREQAILTFLAKTVAGVGPQRTMLMAYAGFGAAVMFASAGMLAGEARWMAGHVVMTVFFLLGLRHSFLIPVELRANWLFRMAEREGREHWRRAIDRFVILFGAFLLIAVPFPLELRLIGWPAVPEAALSAVFGLACYQTMFAAWEKLPFTCSYLPGKKPMWLSAVQLFALLAALPLCSTLLSATLSRPVLYAGAMTALAALALRFHRLRRNGWMEIRLQYEDRPDPAVHGLNLLR